MGVVSRRQFKIRGIERLVFFVVFLMKGKALRVSFVPVVSWLGYKKRDATREPRLLAEFSRTEAAHLMRAVRRCTFVCKGCTKEMAVEEVGGAQHAVCAKCGHSAPVWVLTARPRLLCHAMRTLGVVCG